MIDCTYHDVILNRGEATVRDLPTVEVVIAVERFCAGDSRLSVLIDCIEDFDVRKVPRVGFAAA
jgi:hypothetical protein